MIFVLFAGLAGFCACFSMYAFRKPFTAATFDLVPGWEFALDYKIALVVAQVAGYALSKLIGVKVIAEMRPERRAGAIIILIRASSIALVLFTVVPAQWNVAALFLNGLPLGLIRGLVFGFMEGRRTSEVLGAILCASVILSSGDQEAPLDLPAPDRLVADVEPALRQEFLDISQTQARAEVEPHRMADHSIRIETR